MTGYWMLDLAARLGTRIEQVALGPDRRLHRRDQLLADRVERRVGDLREHLLEVVVEQPRPIRQRGQRRVGAHRSDRLFAGVSPSARAAPADLRACSRTAAAAACTVSWLGGGRYGAGSRSSMSIRCASHSRYGLRRGQLALHLFVRHDAAARRIDQEDAARVQPLLEHDVLGRDVEHADFGRHDDQVVLGDVVARGPEPVAIEDGADHRAVGERNRRRAVPRLHQRRVILVERLQLLRHRLVVLPRLRDHHQDRVRQRSPGHHEELEDVVEGRRVAAALADHRQDLLRDRRRRCSTRAALRAPASS